MAASEEQVRTARWLAIDPALPSRVDELRRAFTARFGAGGATLVSAAPGRAEVLGNHTDYNQGFTLSTNISRNLLLMARPRPDGTCSVASLNLDGSVTFSIDNASRVWDQRAPESAAWARYVQGVVWAFLDGGHAVPGFDALVLSTVPLSGGASSSAALETATARAICAMTATSLTAEAQVELTRRAENEYVGAPCGNLDQATVGLAEGWLFMDHRPSRGRPFTWASVDADLTATGHVLLVGFDPGRSRLLAVGPYAERRSACERSVSAVAALLGDTAISALRDVSVEQFHTIAGAVRGTLGDRVAGFVEHVVTENARVLAARISLEAGDMRHLGALMTESGRSAIDLYDIAEGTPQLRFLYDTVLAHAGEWGVAGIRNMGGGFNASTVALVRAAGVEGFQAQLDSAYRSRYGRPYETMACVPSPAAGLLDVSMIQRAGRPGALPGTLTRGDGEGGRA